VIAPSDPALPEVRELFETTLDRAERIPWEWIVSGFDRRKVRRGGRWPHLVVAEDERGRVKGFFSGMYLSEFAGYACYLGVAPDARRLGIGRRLYQHLFAAFRRDARRLDEALPFVIWESHRPRPEDGPAARAIWQARLRLFGRVGAYRIDGVEFRVPNYMDRGAPPVDLELFLTPFDTPAERLGPSALRAAVAELHQRVYHQGPGDELYERAQNPARRPRLCPVAEWR
jgi:GNAT superfamily N-acetyltransferase